jgi:hypothetical protein
VLVTHSVEVGAVHKKKVFRILKVAVVPLHSERARQTFERKARHLVRLYTADLLNGGFVEVLVATRRKCCGIKLRI